MNNDDDTYTLYLLFKGTKVKIKRLIIFFLKKIILTMWWRYLQVPVDYLNKMEIKVNIL